MLSDATGTLAYTNAAGSVSAEEMLRAHLVALHARFAAVATTEDWIAALHSGEPLPIGNLVASATTALAATR